MVDYQLPINYIEPNNINTWLLDIFDSPQGLPCICGDQTSPASLAVVRPHIIRICQRSSNPAFVEIDFHLGTAQGIYTYQQSISGYSLDTTDGINGTWFELRPDTSDPAHNPSLNNLLLAHSLKVDASWAYALYDPSNPNHSSGSCNANYMNLGMPVHKFVFDMNSHIDTWLAQPSISFRLSFDKISVYNEQDCNCDCTMEYMNG